MDRRSSRASRSPLPSPFRAVGTFSPGIALMPGVRALLSAERLVSVPGAADAPELDAVVSLAGDDGEPHAREWAVARGLPHAVVTTGLIDRVGARGASEPLLSLRFHALEGHADAFVFERWLESRAAELTSSERERAAAIVSALVQNRVSRFNHHPAAQGRVLSSDAKVLVVDTPLEPDATDVHARRATHLRMLDDALRERGRKHVCVLAPRDPWRGLVEGHLSERDLSDRGVPYVTDHASPYALLESVEHVYVTDAHLGFEGLLAGKRVSCFGAPWYAGFGLTDDRIPVARTVRRTLEELVFAAYVTHARYAEPETGKPWQVEDAIAYVTRQRGYFEANRGRIFCAGFTLWKRNFVRAYLRSPDNRIVFIDTARQAARRGFGANDKLLVWGLRDDEGLRQLAAQHGVRMWRMEDGFLRSVGLGADLTMPASLVVDREGIYFDPTGPSELESILQTASFTADELTRARALREQIVKAGVSKYNVGDQAQRLVRPDGATRVILVPGQVEDDASIQRGCRDVRTNLGLLEAVRAQNPDAYILFKPHPDVTHARRQGAVPDDAARALADAVIVGVPLPACLAIADEVHTMTSLVGFEALVRGLSVAAYGQPFYAGWGLTRDRHPVERRTRRLTLDELVAGVLLRYPRYLSRTTRMFTTPEVVVAQLREAMTQSRAPARPTRIGREVRRAMHVLRGLVDAP